MSPTHFLRVFFAALLALSSLAASAQVNSAPALPDLNSAGELGADIFAQSGSTGMVLVVVRGDQVFFRGYGETAPGSRQVPTEDSLVRLCSLTKIFTTDVLTKLVADKTVGLDYTLERYAPRGATVPERRGSITLENLATHTSGLPRELGSSSRVPHFTFPDYQTRWHWLPNQRLRSTPGTEALYSNVAYDFLSDALAVAAHKQYAALLSERTLKPLDLWSTTYFPTAEQCGRLLKSAHDERACAITEATAGSSGLYSSARDMTIWLKYLLGTGGGGFPRQDAAARAVYLKPADLVKQTGLDHAGQPTGVGLGWIHILPLDSESHIVEKTGGGAGFESYIAINDARHTAIFVAATDGVDSHLNLFNATNKMLLAVAGLPPLPEPAPRPVRRHGRRRRR
ncbi:MAG TPA: D-alanyl-D-alanine-carboxypeptidase/endopeptidase AmpH [Terracidiphilus sp.]|jgi:D-alanyl-D-alanine-carboxypeptidase/D-alanyl-D-alanine-endopeptidase|nr:D-alanyl-D-alanine-carboxypeptidase/endopeptidase AmpH [Terracidiphilus sp.]